MTEKDDREQQKADLLWRYIEELKQAENPEEVQFVAVTRGECAEVVGLMETAAEAYVLSRAEAAPNRRREAVRRRLRTTLTEAACPVRGADPAAAASPRPPLLPAWLTAPLNGRSTGWVVAVAALVALLWVAIPRPEKTPAVVPMDHATAVAAIPKFIDGRLDAEQSRALLAHLVRCDGCMELYLHLMAVRLEGRPPRQSALPREKMSFAARPSIGAVPPARGDARLASAAWRS